MSILSYMLRGRTLPFGPPLLDKVDKEDLVDKVNEVGAQDPVDDGYQGLGGKLDQKVSYRYGF